MTSMALHCVLDDDDRTVDWAIQCPRTLRIAPPDSVRRDLYNEVHIAWTGDKKFLVEKWNPCFQKWVQFFMSKFRPGYCTN